MFRNMYFFVKHHLHLQLLEDTAKNAMAIIVCCSWLVILETFFPLADKREHFNIN